MTTQIPAPPASIAVVELPTEVDLATAAAVRDLLLSSINRVGAHLIVDASAVTFMDSSGINALVRARERTDRMGGSLHVVTQSPAVLRILELTQLDRVLAVVPTLADAQRCTANPQTIHTCSGRV